MCMSYAFHTPDKLSFILDLMNGERPVAAPCPQGWDSLEPLP